MARKRRTELPKSFVKKAFFALFVIVLIISAFVFSSLFGASRSSMTATLLNCTPSQLPRAFGNNIVYNDDSYIYCVSPQNNHLWSYAVGSALQYDVGTENIIAWSGNTLHIIDRNGVASYSNSFEKPVLYAKMGSRYAAYALKEGDNSTKVIIIDKVGNIIDNKINPYENVSLLDMGFYENSNYFWVSVLDALGSAPNTRLYWYSDSLSSSSSKTQTYSDLGEEISYKIVYANSILNIINTKEIKRFSYNLSDLNTGNRILVYGWQHIDDDVTGGDAKILLAPSVTDDVDRSISELRLIIGARDLRYTLPDSCVGALIKGNKIYAFSSDALYFADINAQRFSPVNLNNILPQGVNALLAKTNSFALLASGNQVYSVNLP